MIQKYKLYGGKTELLFDDAKHIYSVNGKTVYGTTNILGVLDKPALIYWAVNMAIDYMSANIQPGVALDEIQIKNLLNEAKSAHRQKKDKAADIGSLVHEWIDKFFKAKIEKKPIPKAPINQEMKNALQGLKKWITENKIVPLASEQKIYSKKYGYAGTYDLEAMVNKKRTIIDFKTSNAIYPEYLLQSAAYLQAREEETGNKYDGGVLIVRLSKEDKEKQISPFEVRKMDRKGADELIKVFLSCLVIYRWKENLRSEEIRINNK